MRSLSLLVAVTLFSSCMMAPAVGPHAARLDTMTREERMAERLDPSVSSADIGRRNDAYDEAVAEAARVDAGYYDSASCPPSTNPSFADADAVEKRRLQVLCRRRAELLDAGVLVAR
jgi:hypothetical protein